MSSLSPVSYTHLDVYKRQVSDRHAVNQQDRVDSEEIKQGNQLTCAYAEVFFHYFGDVFARVFPGEHEAGHAAVGEESHREGQNRHDDQGDHAANALSLIHI